MRDDREEMVDIAAWLRGLGLPQYEQAFRDNDIDVELLSDLTVDDLIGLGVSSIGHRRRLLAAIAGRRSISSTAPIDGSPGENSSTAASVPLSKSPDAERRHLTVMFKLVMLHMSCPSTGMDRLIRSTGMRRP
jgi:hypothetical protein